MSFELARKYRFEAAHWLPQVGEDHRCRRLHGHSYEIEVAIDGELDPDLGWVLDYAEIDAVLDPLIDSLDHRCLNEVPGLENPTSELLAQWIWGQIGERLTGLSAVSVCETANSIAIYRG
jgi:6-pyruvoyltetrahydropterin/6-carboxytetrahydropterin synthase